MLSLAKSINMARAKASEDGATMEEVHAMLDALSSDMLDIMLHRTYTAEGLE